MEEIEGDRWPDPPAGATRLTATVHAVRRRPVSALGPKDLRLLIQQNIGLPHLLPRAVDVLRADPLVEGDLLSTVLTRDHAAWAGAPQAARALRLIVAAMDDVPPDLQGEVDDFLALSARL
ncbi:contact-dependent growth inhibition system immunity protein [Streptomyces noursei]|uniref:contact-dependent growth inhibition system immunity protein n=1 Tax=Streptomyces noursei TaxID=1971 RepID=UPI002155AD65|nr:contact-dependent growth inhibition system immunity protein [Streptomyces noursei]